MFESRLINYSSNPITVGSGGITTVEILDGTVAYADMDSAVSASASDVNTGTSTATFVTPDAVAGSNLGERNAVIYAVAAGTALTVADGVAYFSIPSSLDGMNLVRAQAIVTTAGTTNASTVMVHNLTGAADMLSGAISIASAATTGTVGTIDTDNDDVATDDVIRIDVDSISTTPPQGLIVSLEFRLP